MPPYSLLAADHNTEIANTIRIGIELIRVGRVNTVVTLVTVAISILLLRIGCQRTVVIYIGPAVNEDDHSFPVLHLNLVSWALSPVRASQHHTDL